MVIGEAATPSPALALVSPMVAATAGQPNPPAAVLVPLTEPAAVPQVPPPKEKQKSVAKEAGKRRDIFGLETRPAGEDAAEKYIAEREQKRVKTFDIPKHVKYNFGNDATVLFGGVRQVDGQALALLKQGEEVAVLPIDEATVRRLKRVSVGDQISVTAKGAIKTKGRSR